MDAIAVHCVYTARQLRQLGDDSREFEEAILYKSKHIYLCLPKRESLHTRSPLYHPTSRPRC
jgi:hypothetical protein